LFQKLKLIKINDALIAFYFVNFIVFGMKTSLTFELARKAALYAVEATLAKQTALCDFSRKSCTCFY